MNKSLKNSILYEIYPTSFYDSNGDGIGDLPGITQKLEYVKSLGVDILWINPFFLSPFKDGGYDIQDYRKIDPKFGTMADFEGFIKRAKEFGFRVLIDMVIGHTSTEHEWFKESAKSEKNKYSDYYIWTDSVFANFKDKTIQGMYDRDGGYVVNYYGCQPALNFGWVDMEYPNSDFLEQNWKIHYLDERLKPLREEIIDTMKFWLSKGVDGFRVDMASSLVKKEYGSYLDEDPERIKGIKWVWEQLMNGVKKDYPDTIFFAEWAHPRVAVGECGFDNDYIGHDCPEFNCLFRNEKGTNLMKGFEIGHNYFSKEGKGQIESFIKYSKSVWEKTDGKGYFSAPSGCHDAIRLFSGIKDKEVMKTAYAFLLTYKHIPFFYYGDEIGMKHNFDVRKDGGGIRTGCRTPMQWNNEKNRGFSTSDNIYLPVNNDEGVSVIDQENDENSLLNAFKELVKIRKENSCLNADASIEFISTGYPLSYIRSDKNNSALIIINPSDKLYFVPLKGYKKPILLHNSEISNDSVKLSAQGYAIILLK